MRCPKCDFKVGKKDKFCPFCGHDLSEKVEETIETEVVEEKESELKEDVKKDKFKYSEGYEREDIEATKIYSLFSYLGLLFIIPLIACQNSKYARFHINQGIILCIVDAIFSGIQVIFGYLPHNFLLEITGDALDICLIILTVYGIYNAVTGQAKKLPVIGNFNILK